MTQVNTHPPEPCTLTEQIVTNTLIAGLLAMSAFLTFATLFAA